MKPRSVIRRAALAAVLFAIAQATADAQVPVTKAPRRLPPNDSASGRIPAGVDTGTSTTSDTLPLGTPVPPTLGADTQEMKTRSAAARAAARPKPPASSADCARTPAEAAAAAKAASGPRVGPPAGAASKPAATAKGVVPSC